MTGEGLWTAEKPKLYVGCALTDAPQAFKDDVEATKDGLGADWRVLKFLGLVSGTTADVYRRDLGNVDECDAFLAITDYPSTGLGMEIGRAAETGTPTLLVARASARVTRMVLGASALVPGFKFERYENMRADLPGLVNQAFARILNLPETNAISKQGTNPLP